jgi:hypothetical protein
LFHGPVLLPKLYKGRDKTFWLAGWERHFENSGTNSVRTTSADTARNRPATNHPPAATHATMPRKTMLRP